MHRFWVLIIFTSTFAQEVRWACDLSFVPKLEHNGAVFRQAGVERSALQIFRSAGFELVRLRLWHTPTEPWHGIDSVLAFAERAHDLGFKILLDIHYSDTWADPAHQTKPEAWQSLSYAQLLDSVYSHTNNVIRRFRDVNVIPEAVQIGNEIGGGMLWNTGRITGQWNTDEQWNQLAALMDTAVAGVRDSLTPSQWPKIVLHHQEGGNAGACQWFFSQLESRDVDFDIIGLSYYPWWHGTLDNLSNTLTTLYSAFDKDVHIVETAYPWMTGWCDNTGNIVGDQTPILPGYPATESGQAQFLEAVEARLLDAPNRGTRLLCPWEPAWIPTEVFGSPWENLAFFDCDGDALQIMNIFPGLTPTNLTITRIGSDITLRWRNDASPYYRVYASDSSDGPFTELLGSTSANTWLLENEVEISNAKYFVVEGSMTP